MKLESKWLEKLENFLIKKGYTKRQKGLVAYGGKNNGTVDLMATNEKNGKSIIIEIKNNPIHLIDLSHYLSLMKNIKEQCKKKDIKFFLLTCEYEISPIIKKMGKDRGVIIENINEFISRKRF